MISVSKTITIPMGHRLLEYEGACKNIHGHNWKIVLNFYSDTLDKHGFVIDFGFIKREFGLHLDLLFDHAMIVNPYDIELIDFLQEQESKYFIMPHVTEFNDRERSIALSNPTAENIAKVIYDMADKFAEEHNIRVGYVDIYESDTSIARYEQP